MKTIKTLLLVGLTPFLLSGLTSCTDYQDEIDALDGRVAYLESLVSKVNDNIAALQKIVNTLKNSGSVKSVTQTETGYVITIQWIKQNPDGTITTYEEAFPVFNGNNGADAKMPNITVGRNPNDPTDTNYYWFIDGKPVTSPTGDLIRANGVDGVDGNDGITPKVRINPETNQWEVSTDGGNKWDPIGPATGNNGKDAPILLQLSDIDNINGWVYFAFYDPDGNYRGTIKLPYLPV